MAAEVILFPVATVRQIAPAALRSPAEAYLDLRRAAADVAAINGRRSASETLLALAVEMEDSDASLAP